MNFWNHQLGFLFTLLYLQLQIPASLCFSFSKSSITSRTSFNPTNSLLISKTTTQIHTRSLNSQLANQSESEFIGESEIDDTSTHGRIYSASSDRMEILAKRLSSCGVKNYYFVNDNDETDQMVPVTQGDQIVLQRAEQDEIRKDEIVNVKTLVWKGTFLRNTTRTSKSTSIKRFGHDIDEDGDEKKADTESSSLQDRDEDDHFYFVTALRAEDKVDIKKLRVIIKDEFRQKGTLILQIADKDHAEKITGFASGSMPPGWHSLPLKLYIDDYIVESFNKTESGISNLQEEKELNEDGVGDNGNHYSKIIMSMGSGSSDFSLHVSLLDTILSSIYLQDRIPVCEELGIDLKSNAHTHGRYVTSFTRTRAEDRNKEKQKVLSSRQQQSTRVFSVGVKEDFTSTSDNENKPVKLTRKLFQVIARKKGKVTEMKQLIDALGDDFAVFMHVDTGIGEDRFATEFNKNALHYAAWKGDIETMTLLIKESKRFDGIRDAVNLISKGLGCYGKTPIYYAITQCRDDVVLYLLTQGASLLIVNNKGQSPCSLAVNKLKPETCRVMFQTEEAQLMAGGQFANYRHSHSDGRRYGDLDPRFLQAGDINMDEEVEEQLELFQKYKKLELNKERERMLSDNPCLKFSIPESCLPRSVRVMSAGMWQAIRSKDMEDRRTKQQEEQTLPSELSLPRSVRVTTPIWMQESYIQKQEEKLRHQPAENESNASDGKKQSNKNRNRENRPSSTNNVQLLDGTEIDMTLLPTLKLSDILASGSDGEQVTYELVDDDLGAMVLDFAVDETLALIKDLDAESLSDDQIVNSSWGLDCEWRPSRMPGEANPVATLQLSSKSRSFVVDTQRLFQGGIVSTKEDLTEVELAMSRTLSKLLSNKAVRIVGFGIAQDLSKLAASFPHLPCFRTFHSVIDLHSLSRLTFPKKPKHFMSSLQKTASIFLRKRLDKAEQCSEWNVRPLRPTQLEYASLDATVLPILLGEILHSNSVVEQENGFFLRKNAGVQTSYRFTFLEDRGDRSYNIPMGSLKTSYMDLKLARQTWPTLNKKPPALPEKVLHEQNAVHSANRKEPKVKKPREWKLKKNAIELTVLSVDLRHLPEAGMELGYTKESCIEHIVKKEVIDALPEDSYLRYNRRGGIVELGNCWMLFVNFGVGKIHSKYENLFLEGAKQVTFTINPSRYEDGELLQNLLIQEGLGMYRKAVLLFIRGSTTGKFLSCGECICDYHQVNEDNDLVNLVLELKQFEALKKDVDGEISTYMRLVSENLSSDVEEIS